MADITEIISRQFQVGYRWLNMNNVDSDHGDPVIVHLRCLCDFSLLRFEKDVPSVAGSFRQCAAISLMGSPSVLRLVYLF